jgi:UDP-2,4-diacetamido-2,4,6-trideoxy-beta-L-altropyranose hydrolase
MRALALADALRESGWSCTLAVNPDVCKTVPALAESWHRIETVGNSDQPPMREPIDLLVVDHYGLDAAFERACRPLARHLLVIDDLADRDHDTDILVDPTPGQAPDRYRGRVAPKTRCLTGPAYAPLRPQFQAARGSRRDAGDRVERVLVAAGAVDRTGLTRRAIEGARRALPEAWIDVVGAGRGVDRADERVRFLDNVSDMASLYGDADICIGAVGVSALERCCVGLPTLAVITADNQRLVAQGLSDAGAIGLLGEDGAVDAGTIAEAMSDLTPDSRGAMTQAGRDLCDGRGLQRIQLAIAGVDTAEPIGLRLAGPADGGLMYDWQCNPRTRRYARNSAPPSPEEHARWLSEVLNDPNRVLMMVCEEGSPIGVLRFDALQNGAREVSIYMKPNIQGRGYGRRSLVLGRKLFSNITIEAEILPGNIASRRAFEAAGFVAKTETLLVAPAN